MTSLLESHPRWVEHLDKVAEVERRQAARREAARKTSLEWADRQRDWQDRRERALDAGEPFLSPPPEPPPSDAMDEQLHMQRLTELGREGKQLLAEIRDDVEVQAVEVERGLRDEARPLVEQLAEIAVRARELVTDVGKVRHADGDYRHLSPPGVVRLVEAMTRNESLLEPPPEPGRQGVPQPKGRLVPNEDGTVSYEPPAEPDVITQRPQPTRGLTPPGAFGRVRL